MFTSLRYLLDIQVIQVLWEKEHPWLRGCRGQSVLREELSYGSSEKKKEPFREACGCRDYTKDGRCLAEGNVGRVQRVEGEWNMGSDRGQAEPWGGGYSEEDSR